MALAVIKFLMITTNIIFWLIGGTLLGLGIWMAVDSNAFQALTIANSAGMDDALWSVVVYTMIGVGSFIFLVGFLGCCGTLKVDKKGGHCMLWMYFAFIKIIILAEIACIILAAIFWGSINDDIKTGMTNDVKTKYVNETSDDGISTAWNQMQVSWKCCGGALYTDYRESNYASNYGALVVPWTCCVMKPGTKGKTIDDVLNEIQCRIQGALPPPTLPDVRFLHSQGCYDGLYKFVEDNSIIIIAVLASFIGLEILAMVFSCLLMKCN
jgi:hypothetical protein